MPPLAIGFERSITFFWDGWLGNSQPESLLSVEEAAVEKR